MTKYLTKSEILELDRQIDQRIAGFDLLSRNKDQALFHVLQIFEEWINSKGNEPDLKIRRLAYRTGYDGFHHAIEWVYQYCPNSQNDAKPQINIEDLQKARDLFFNSIEYSHLWANMALLHRGRAQCEIIEPNFYEFSAVSLKDYQLGTAGLIFNSATDPETPEDAHNITEQTRACIKQKLKIKQQSDSEIKYSLPAREFQGLINNLMQRSLTKWAMNLEWDLGGYTFRQLRKFWFTLQLLCIIQDIALECIPSLETRINLRIRLRDVQEWVDEISEKSKLSKRAVKQIIEDLTYDSSLHQSGKPKAHVMSQPFFRFSNGELGVSNKIVQISNIERNVWSLISLIRPGLRQDLQNLKEQFWIENFRNKVEKLGLKCFPDIKFKSASGKGNIDLLILNMNLKFGLICELKWLTSTDDVKGVVSDDEQMSKGVDQAQKAFDWVISDVSLLAQKINFNNDELKLFDFKPLVISKESPPSGFLGETIVPIIDERLFDWVIAEPHYRDLRSLWRVAETKSYLPRFGKHFQIVFPSHEWGEMKFRIKDLAYELTSRWDPLIDIEFDS